MRTDIRKRPGSGQGNHSNVVMVIREYVSKLGLVMLFGSSFLQNIVSVV